MTPFDAALLGVVEGITEFLPVSSTGHLILTSALLNIGNSEFLKTFEIVIQLGAILAVVVLFFRSFLDIEILKRLIVGFIPTSIIGLALYHVVKTYLIGNEAVVLWALALGGVALIAFDMFHVESAQTTGVRSITYRQAATLGLFQSVAIIPGISRSAATIVGGLMLGIERGTIVEFSFLLAVPTMVAASGLDLMKNASSFSGSDALSLSIGFIVSFIVALFAIKWLLNYVRHHSFWVFGVYRILIALAFFFLILR